MYAKRSFLNLIKTQEMKTIFVTQRVPIQVLYYLAKPGITTLDPYLDYLLFIRLKNQISVT